MWKSILILFSVIIHGPFCRVYYDFLLICMACDKQLEYCSKRLLQATYFITKTVVPKVVIRLNTVTVTENA